MKSKEAVLNQSHADRESVESVVRLYFSSYLNADADGLARAFHADTRLLAIDSELLEETPLASWLPSVRARREAGDFRQAETRIESVDLSGDAAAVKATLRFPDFQFTDYLSLLRIQGAWRIVGKIYTRQQRGGVA